MEANSIAQIILQLHQTGALLVPRSLQPGELERAMAEIASERELEAPGPSSLHPRADITTACWAAVLLVQGARFLLFREIEADEVRRVMRQPAPLPPDAERAWSADLAFCFLPDLLRRARAVSEDDELTVQLASLQAAWSLDNWPDDPFLAAVCRDRRAEPVAPTVVERPWLVPSTPSTSIPSLP